MKNQYFLYIFLLLNIVGCKENEVLEYENDPRLYFYNSSYGQHDSISQTFFILPEEQMRDTVWIDVRTMGYPADDDRPFQLIQTNIGIAGAAVAGTHFIPLDGAEIKGNMTMKAGQVKANVPIIFLKDPSILTGSVRLELAIAETEYFSPGIDKWSAFVINSTAMAVKPTNWDSAWKVAFGTWGSVKMKFIIDYVGFTDFEAGRPSDSSYYNYLKGKARQKLFEYNADPAHEQLTEADGTIVEFPA